MQRLVYESIPPVPDGAIVAAELVGDFPNAPPSRDQQKHHNQFTISAMNPRKASLSEGGKRLPARSAEALFPLQKIALLVVSRWRFAIGTVDLFRVKLLDKPVPAVILVKEFGTEGLEDIS